MTVDAPSYLTPAGRIVGWRDGSVIRATGIRYARASRNQPPTLEPDSSSEVLATEWAPACAQAPHPLGETMLTSALRPLDTTEDCLRLSLTLPANSRPGDSRPVMVWIHGGSYVFGAGDAAVHDPRALVEEHGVIVVAVTYRLGLFGFLGGAGGRIANLGLMDIIAALRWIKANIAAFGGDPECVTLFGQSAGGDAIAHLMIAESAQDLFRRAIIQSAPLGLSLGRHRMSEAMLRVALSGALDAPTADVIAAQTAVTAASQGFGWVAGMPFGTQYGHAPLPPEQDIDAAWSKSAQRFDVLIGYAAEEGSFYIPMIESLRKLAELPLIGGLMRSVTIRTITRKVYATAAMQFAKRHARAGGRAFLYRILWGSRTNGLGATHAIDLPLLFGDADIWRDSALIDGLSWDEVDQSARRLRAVWAQFARSGRLPERDLATASVVNYSQA